MTKKTFAALLSKEIGGNISKKERTELQQTLTEDRRMKEIYDEIHIFMQERESRNDMDIDAKLDEVWDKIGGMSEVQYRTSPSRKHIIPVWGRIAVTAAILVGLGWLAYYYYLPGEDLYSQVMDSGDENLYAVLDDGTQVWLNKHSRIAYNDRFGEKHRKIRLTGKAFFDVAYRPGVPLTVTARDVDVMVKGTAFNIDAVSPDIEVALIRGLVAVKDNRKKNTKEILLQPNQKIVVRDGHILSSDSSYVVRDLVQENDTIIPETQWLKGSLVFQKQRFSDLVKLMEERYRVTIKIKNAALAEQRFTGSIKSETLQQMLDALKQSYPFTYEINGKEVIIR
ncbi:FecR domain-containing protein [uncultured Proteiniphilum sp.]|uniref:FecR family protein n=1 Tax=uncultured Proteiniphilum sp. TaxID=497637 RepID=UPI002636C8EA|nr:FecR domain-containing protein [uncultured Proteiniphilum sp.]